MLLNKNQSAISIDIKILHSHTEKSDKPFPDVLTDPAVFLP